ncbi:MAG: radical SAM protein [Syntrophobacterales bacterium]|nr:radical SAM protein [Syntrophobacterales bacterium]
MRSSQLSFEQGPIRPPSEAASLLLRFTRNCPWNKCTFCPVYKNSTFSRRSLEEIKKDIDRVVHIIEDIKGISWSLGEGGKITSSVLQEVMMRSRVPQAYYNVAQWLFFGTGQVFIQDANSLIMPSAELAEAIAYLRTKIPGVKRVTSYGRSSTISRKSLEELIMLREAGLDRIHIGMESGSDRVLKYVRKGATARQHIEAGHKVKAAGITLSEYIMPGLGGKAWSEEHALETARVLTDIDPDFIRLRTLMVPPFGSLWEDVLSGRFVPLTDDETVKEIRLMIESLGDIHSTLTSDHIRNLLEDVNGKFPEDRKKMLTVIDEYLSLPPEDKILFRLGRRGGALRSVREIQNPMIRLRLEKAKRDLERELGQDVESIIGELAAQYI